MVSKREKNKVNISAITWNMGNRAASKKVIADLLPQLLPTKGSRPEVIVVATQEEMAPTGARLQDLLLEELNKDLMPDQQYEIVQTKEPQFHTTMAGSNQKMFTLAQSLLTSDNRVSSAILVKKPLSLDGAVAQIDYEQGKERGNKSVITIKGKLTFTDKSSVDLSVSAGHWDSKSETKRREHANKFLTKNGIKSSKLKTFDQIYKDASTLNLLLGDFNERDYLMKSGTATDEMRHTVYPSYGYDVVLRPRQLLGDKKLHGTYGYQFEDNDWQAQQLTNVPDTRKRAHVAKGGYLDRVAYSSGLSVLTKNYGVKLDKRFFKLNSDKKWCYHHSDHTPVIRNLEVEMPALNKKEIIVSAYIKRCLPDFSDDCSNFIFLLTNAEDLNQLRDRATELMPHDSTLEPVQFLKQLANVEQDNFESILKGLEEKQAQKEKLFHLVLKLTAVIDMAGKNKDTQLLEDIFNTMEKCNALRNASLEMMSQSVAIFSDVKKMQFMKIADELIDLFYLQELNRLAGGENFLSHKFVEVQNKMDQFIAENPFIVDKFSKLKDEYITFIHVVNPSLK